MLVGYSLVLGEVIRSKLDLNSLEGKNELLADDGEDKDEDEEETGNLVPVGEGIFDLVEGVSLDKGLKLAINS